VTAGDKHRGCYFVKMKQPENSRIAVPKTADADLHGVRFAKCGKFFLDRNKTARRKSPKSAKSAW
jgi:hypothetical protein